MGSNEFPLAVEYKLKWTLEALQSLASLFNARGSCWIASWEKHRAARQRLRVLGNSLLFYSNVKLKIT